MSLGAWWLVAAMLVAPLAVFPAVTGIGIAQAKNGFFIMLGLALVVWRMPNGWLQAFAALAVLGTMRAGLTSWAMVGLLGILAWLLVYEEASRLSDRAWHLLRIAACGAVGVQLAWMAVQWFGLDPLFRPLDAHGQPAAGPAPVVGWFSNASDTALFLGLSLPLVAALSPWLLLPCALGLAILRSTGGVACLAVVMLWLAARARSWAITGALGLLVVVGAAGFFRYVDPPSGGYRVPVWKHATALVALQPLTGWGPNAVGHRLQIVRANTERWEFLHNEWLQGALEFGVGGPALAAAYLVTLGWRLRHGRWREAGEAVPAAVALVLVSLFSIPLRIGPTALLAALYLGRLEGKAGTR